MTMKILVILFLIIIVYSLGSALFSLMKSGDSPHTVKMLTWRIGLSLVLFALLMLGNVLGWIQPHGLLPTPQP